MVVVVEKHELLNSTEMYAKIIEMLNIVTYILSQYFFNLENISCQQILKKN